MTQGDILYGAMEIALHVFANLHQAIPKERSKARRRIFSIYERAKKDRKAGRKTDPIPIFKNGVYWMSKREYGAWVERQSALPSDHEPKDDPDEA